MMADIAATGLKRALVTGANGYIAGRLVLRLLEQGVAVVAVCRDPRKGAYLRGAEVVQGYVTDGARMRELAQGCDVVFHVAAAFNEAATVQYRTNVIGSVRVAEAAQAAHVRRFVHVSTIGVYGIDIDGRITEAHAQHPSPRDFYQQSKKLGEDAVWDFAKASGLPTTVIRPAMVYGSGSAFWSRMLYQLTDKLPFVPQFSGTAHPIYIDDVVDMLLLLATHPDAVGEAFHCAPDPAPIWPEYVGHFARMLGKTRTRSFPAAGIASFVAPLELLLRLKSDAPTDISGTLRFVSRHATYSMDKARELLGWEPRVPLAEGMAASEAWLRGEVRDVMESEAVI